MAAIFLGYRIWLLNFAGGNHPFSWIQSHRVELSLCVCVFAGGVCLNTDTLEN